MKGSKGVSMQGVEHRTPAKGNHMCKDCKHLTNNFVTVEKSRRRKKNRNLEDRPPFKCEVTNKGLYYTTKCYCNHFASKEENKLPDAILKRLGK